MNNQRATRHMTWETLKVYLRSGTPALIPISGDPGLQLVIEPRESRIALRGPWNGAGSIPDLTQFRKLDTKVETGSEGDWIELGISGNHVLQEAHQLLVLLADRVQIHDEPIGKAISHIISSYREMLSALSRLSLQQEIGLFGELLILKSLLQSLDESEAVASWMGPLGEEHDFALHDLDLEIKTTTFEERIHKISSISQLEPSHRRALWLVSIMITSKGIEGSTIGQIIELLRAMITSPEVRAELDYKLSQSGWDDEYIELYTQQYCLRTDVVTYEVTPDFPAITAHKLQKVGIPSSRITNLSYLLRLDDLPSQPLPTALKEINCDK